MLFTIAGEQITQLFQNYLTQDQQWQMIATASVFLSSGVENLSDQPLIKYDPQLEEAHQTRQLTTVLLNNPYKANFQQNQQLLSVFSLMEKTINFNQQAEIKINQIVATIQAIEQDILEIGN